jgi:hypothetical protein
MGYNHLLDDNYRNWSSDVSAEKDGIKGTNPVLPVYWGIGVCIDLLINTINHRIFG